MGALQSMLLMLTAHMASGRIVKGGAAANKAEEAGRQGLKGAKGGRAGRFDPWEEAEAQVPDPSKRRSSAIRREHDRDREDGRRGRRERCEVRQRVHPPPRP